MAKFKGDILVVDDEPNAVKVLSAILTEEGYYVHESSDVTSATDLIHKKNVDLVITDLKMPGRDGMEFFGYIREQKYDIPVIFLTAYGSVDSAVSAMLGGALYYFIKPPDYSKLKDIIARAITQKKRRQEAEAIGDTHPEAVEIEGLIGNAEEMRRISATIGTIKDSASTVLISGETGTGKELISRALHYSGKRKEHPLCCGQLCGHPQGAHRGRTVRM